MNMQQEYILIFVTDLIMQILKNKIEVKINILPHNNDKNHKVQEYHPLKSGNIIIKSLFNLIKGYIRKPHTMETLNDLHQIWFKCMQMRNCSKQQAIQFVNLCLPHLNTPLTHTNQTLIMIGSSVGAVQVVSECLKRGADVKHRDSVGRNVLHYAASVGCLQIFQQLISHGGNAMQQSIGGESPLTKACMFSQGDIIEWYLNQCIQAFEIRDKSGNKPLDVLRMNSDDLYQEVSEIYKDLVGK